MRVLIILLLLCASAGAIKTGWIFLVIPFAVTILLIIKKDRTGQSIDSFFALCFFGGITTVLWQIGRSVL